MRFTMTCSAVRLFSSAAFRSSNGAPADIRPKKSARLGSALKPT